jgi:hypothetical protein
LIYSTIFDGTDGNRFERGQSGSQREGAAEKEGDAQGMRLTLLLLLLASFLVFFLGSFDVGWHWNKCVGP